MKFVLFFATLVAGILIGGFVGWTLKPQPETPRGNGPDTALERPRPSRPATASPSRFAAELQAIKDGNFKLKRDGSDKDSGYLEALAAALLKSCGGYSRMESEEKQSFDKILTAMALKNLERTLDWIDQSLDDKDRAKNCREAIQTAMKDSPVRERLDLFKGRGFTPDEIETYAGNLMMGSERLSTETALYLQGHVQPSDGGASGGHARFESGFDFARFADSVLQTAKANKNRPPSVYPMNFFSEWTRSDPQAAAGFYFTNCIGKEGLKLPFNDLESFMKDLQANVPQSDYDQFAAAALSQQFLALEPDAAAIDQLLRTGFSIPEDLAESLSRIPDPVVREELLIDTVIRAARSSQRGSLMQLRGALSLYRDPVSRIGSVESYARELSGSKGDEDAPQIIRNLCNQLAILGHSDADLQRVRDAAGEYGR
ncbi:MAG: hypothetical protein ACRDBP_17860 [Luteolibacter sp.]